MLLRTLLIVLLSQLLILQTKAQGLEGIIVERYYLSDDNDATDAIDNGAVTPLTVGSTTYRIYVDMADGYKFSQIFGTSAHPLTVNSTADFFNDPNYGVMINPGTISANNIKKHTAMIDSWFTTGGVSNSKVGVLKSEDNDGTVGNQHGVLANNAGGCYGLPITGTSGQDGMIPSSAATYLVPNSLGLGSALSALDQTAGNSILIDNGAIAALGGIVGPTSTNRVLIAQFTTFGELTFELNVQLVNISTGDAENYVASNPGTGELTHPSLTRTINTSPSVSITNPVNNAIVPIGNLNITADASDNGMIQQIEFFVDGNSLGVDTSSPFTLTYNVSAGSHQVYAVVTDNDCSTSTSSTILFSAANNNPPTISLNGPTTAITGTTVTYTATASDTDGSVSMVEFFINGNSLGTDNSSPYSIDYVTTFGNGQNVIAIATDNQGSSTTSNAIILNVVNNAAPSVTISSPLSSDIFIAPQIVTIVAAANDTDGNIQQVEFYVNGSSIGVDLTAPYSMEWTSEVGTADITAIATDNLGESTTSLEVSITIADPNALPYAITTSYVHCDESAVCVPLTVSVTQPVDNVLGYDISLSYDADVLTPTGTIEVGGTLVNPATVDYTVNTSVPGIISFSLFFDGSAGAGAEFNGFGELCCIQFLRTANFSPTDTTSIDILSVQESYISGVELATGTGGSIISSVDPIYEGTLLYWFNLTPISYDVQSPDEFDPTTIQGVENGEVVNTSDPAYPDLLGHFEHNLLHGDSLYINRDIDNNESIQHLINGADAFLLKSMFVNNEFIPSYSQIACMDVNLDGTVSAGDLTQIMQRATHAIGEFQQAWNYDDQGNSNGQPSKDWVFYSQFNTQLNPSYNASTSFPDVDGIGFDVNHLPEISFVLPSHVANFSYDGSTCPDINTDNYIGMLLGDINGSFVNYSDVIIGNDSIIFDLGNMITTEISGNYYVEIPVSIHSTLSAKQAQDFRFKFNTEKMTFLSTSFIAPDFYGMDHYNNESEYLSVTGSVGSYFQNIPNNQTNMTLRFQLTSPCVEIQPTDFFNVEAYLDGYPVHSHFTNPTSLPAITINSTAPYCSNTDITFEYATTISDLELTNYAWSSTASSNETGNPVNISFNNFGQQTLTLEATATNGCTYTVTTEIMVLESPLVNFTSLIDNDTFTGTFTNTTTASTTSISEYLWDFGDSNTSNDSDPTHTYDSAALYTVSLTATTEEGCQATYTSTVDIVDGVDEINLSQIVVCYPNPATDMLSVITHSPTDVEIRDLSGKLWIQYSITDGGTHTISTSTLASGVYFISFTHENYTQQMRLVITK
ncbi:MAG: T9SS type A sorting domain-containing protein [Flavobacteriales bacterium]|nr:T9SS type A sorting domain-containing protein [Flavobacteriales bacterium]